MGLRQDFEAAMESVKTELIVDLNKTDVLNGDNLKSLQREFNQKLVNIQVQLLRRLPDANSKIRVEFQEQTAATLSDFGTITFYSAATGATAYAAGTFITLAVPQIVTATSWIFWTTSTTVAVNVSLAAYLAGLLGISVSVATTLMTGGAAAIIGLIAYWSYFPIWRWRLRDQMIQDFEKTIRPSLRYWCDDVIKKATQESDSKDMTLT